MSLVYLICSDSVRLLEDEVKKITKDKVVTTYDLNNDSLNDVLDEASYFSLFDEMKYMVVKNASIFGASKKKKDEESTSNKKDERLLSYLEEPNSHTTLIFTYMGKMDSKKKIGKIIKDKYSYIEVGGLKAKDIYTLLEKKLKNDGYKIDKNSLYYVINNSLNNYDLAYNEVLKIELYYGKGCNILFDDVTNIVSRTIEESNFKFIDAVMEKNIKEAFSIYDDLMIQKVEPLLLLILISKEIRNTLLVKKLIAKKNKKEMMSILDIHYDFMIDKLINRSYSFKEEELEKYLVELCDFDYQVKSGKISNKLALEMFILDFCK